MLFIGNDNFSNCSTSSFNRSEHINSDEKFIFLHTEYGLCIWHYDAMEACHFNPVYIGTVAPAFNGPSDEWIPAMFGHFLNVWTVLPC